MGGKYLSIPLVSTLKIRFRDVIHAENVHRGTLQTQN